VKGVGIWKSEERIKGAKRDKREEMEQREGRGNRRGKGTLDKERGH
jgi:hypothetical protein